MTEQAITDEELPVIARFENASAQLSRAGWHSSEAAAPFCLRQMGKRSAIRGPLVDFQLEAKARQASKLAEIREALIAAGCDTTATQAAVLGVCRSTAWALLNRVKRVGPSAKVIKRILSSPNLPPAARRKIEEYIEERIAGLYGHTEMGRVIFAIDFVSRLNHRSRIWVRHQTVQPSIVE